MRVIAASFVWIFSATASGADFYLSVGEQLQTDIVARNPVRLAQSRALKIEALDGKVFLIAKQPGEATFTVGGSSKNYKVIVYSAKVAAAKSETEAWVSARESLTLSIKPSSLRIKGRIDTVEDWLWIHEKVDHFRNILSVQLEMTPLVLKNAIELIQKEIKENSLTAVKLIRKNGQLKLAIRGRSPDQDAPIQDLAQKWGLVVIKNSSLVELKPMIEIDVTVAEVRKASATRIGLKLPGSYSATVIPTSDFTSFASTFAPIHLELNAQDLKGAGKIVANPRLLCRSGDSAEFLAGGEIPIKVSGWKNSEVSWKKYGVMLSFSPLADSKGSISTKIEAEISLLDHAEAVGGIPGIRTNRVETHINIQGAKTIALSGLIKNEAGRATDGLPGLSSIPVLGEIFKSHEFLENKTELIVFVTPKVVMPDEDLDVKAEKFLWGDET